MLKIVGDHLFEVTKVRIGAVTRTARSPAQPNWIEGQDCGTVTVRQPPALAVGTAVKVRVYGAGYVTDYTWQVQPPVPNDQVTIPDDGSCALQIPDGDSESQPMSADTTTPATADPVGFTVARGALVLLPPVTLITALLFYFGWAKVTREAGALGASDTVFAYSTSDYLLRSVDSLYFPLMVLTAAGTARPAHPPATASAPSAPAHPDGCAVPAPPS